MKCPICGKDFDSVDCLHWGPDLIKEIERLNRNKNDAIAYIDDPKKDWIRINHIKEILERK